MIGIETEISELHAKMDSFYNLTNDKELIHNDDNNDLNTIMDKVSDLRSIADSLKEDLNNTVLNMVENISEVKVRQEEMSAAISDLTYKVNFIVNDNTIEYKMRLISDKLPEEEKKWWDMRNIEDAPQEINDPILGMLFKDQVTIDDIIKIISDELEGHKESLASNLITIKKVDELGAILPMANPYHRISKIALYDSIKKVHYLSEIHKMLVEISDDSKNQS